jgi:hypothetical protein
MSFFILSYICKVKLISLGAEITTMTSVRYIVILILLIAVIAGIFFTTREDAVYIKVSVNLTQLNDTPVPRIDNLTAILVPTTKVSEPKETDLFAPGILVVPFKNATMIGYWTSVPYNGTGTYNLNVGLTEYPKKGDEVLINIRFLDANGVELNSLTYGTALK